MERDYPYIDLTYLEQTVDGDRAFQRERLRMLIRGVQEEIPRMRTLQAAGDWPGLCEVSHRFKATIGFSGCRHLAGATAEIEALAEDGKDPGRLAELLAVLEAAQPHVLAELREADRRLET